MSKLFNTYNLKNLNPFISPEKKQRYYNSFLKRSGILRRKINLPEDFADDFIYKEMQKAKLQGFFDPSSRTNKNIFIDNEIIFPEYEMNSHEMDPLSGKERKIYYKNMIMKQDEGKNLIVLNSQTQYPFKSYKYNKFFNMENMKNSRINLRNKFCYESMSIKNNNSERGIVDLSISGKNLIYSTDKNLKKTPKTVSLSCSQNIKNEKKFERSYNINSEYYDDEYSTKSSKAIKSLMDGYRKKLFILFFEHIHLLFQKNKQKNYNLFKSKIKNINKNKINIITLNKQINLINENRFNKRNTNSNYFNVYNSNNLNTLSDNFPRITKSNNKKVMVFKKKIIYRNSSNIKKNIETKNLNTVSIKKKNMSNITIKNLNLKQDIYNKSLNCSDKNINIIHSNILFTDTSKKNNDDLSNNKYKNYNSRNCYNEIIASRKRKHNTIIMTKKIPKYQFNQIKKNTSCDLSKHNNLNKEFIDGATSPLSKIKFQEIFSYISRDKKLQICLKNSLTESGIIRVHCRKHISHEILNCCNNLLKIERSCDINILTGNNYKKISNNIVNIYKSHNSNKLNKGILLLENLITKNYEDKFNNSDSNIGGELLNNNEEENRIKISEKKNHQKILSNLINDIENKNNILLLNKYFNIYKKNIQNNSNETSKNDDSQIHNLSIISDDCSVYSEKSLISVKSSSKKISETQKVSTGCLPSISSRGEFLSDKKLINKSNSITKRMSIIKNGNESENISDGTDVRSNKEIRVGSFDGFIKKNSNESFYEFYSKYEDFIFSLRMQLIYCFLRKKNNEIDSSMEYS